MKFVEYILEIYMPDNIDDVWMIFRSETPFMTISIGDTINPASDPNTPYDFLYKVTSVQHLVFESEVAKNYKQKLMIYGIKIPNDRDARLATDRL